jgi:putative transcription factor
MRCEVCGDEIRGQPYRRIIEGGKMTVCGRCASFGTAEWTPDRPRDRPMWRPVQRRPRSDVEAAETLAMVDDYGAKIRKARQKMGMNVEDFAGKINEKESVIKKLEKEELNPDGKLIRKIGSALKIELLEVGEAPVAARVARRASTGRTLGDIWKISQSKAKDEEEEEKGEPPPQETQ